MGIQRSGTRDDEAGVYVGIDQEKERLSRDLRTFQLQGLYLPNLREIQVANKAVVAEYFLVTSRFECFQKTSRLMGT